MLSQPEPVLAHLAQNLRRLRLAAGISQQELAKRAGLSRRMINGVEAGTTNISLTNLDRLASALHLTFVDLVTPMQASRDNVQALIWQGRAPESRAELLGSVPASRIAELWRWSLAPGDRYDAEPDPDGFHEMISVTHGVLTIQFANQRKRIDAGAFFIFSSAQTYAYLNEEDGIVHFLRNVVS